jgi:hypothetical protein
MTAPRGGRDDCGGQRRDYFFYGCRQIVGAFIQLGEILKGMLFIKLLTLIS